MGCINKSSKEYLKLFERYGDRVADILIRTNPKNRNTQRDQDFYIPTLREVNRIIKSKIPQNAVEKLDIKLKQNPFMNEDGIASFLRGIINKKGDTYLVSIGDTSGILQREISKTEVYMPNLRAMRALERKYPDIFEVKETKNDFTHRVIITPRSPETTTQEQEDTFAIQPSIDAFADLTQRLGYAPLAFEVGSQRWEQVSGSVYNLINKYNYTVLERNVNLQSGSLQEKTTPVNEKERDMAVAEIQELATNDYINELFGLNGLFLEDILDEMRNADTQEQFTQSYKKILKILC